MATKKGRKAKHLSVDLNESQFLKESTSVKKNKKHPRNEGTEEESISKLIGQYQNNSKKKKLEVNVKACKESRKKILDVMNHQLETRKEKSDTLLENISEVVLLLKADCTAMKDNEKKPEHLLADVNAKFKKQWEEMESDHKVETDKLAEELGDDIKKLAKKWLGKLAQNNFSCYAK